MLKPVTVEEKLTFTLQLQAEKARDELLAEIYYEGYEGHVDIWPEVKKGKGVEFKVLSAKILNPLSPLTNKNATRFLVTQGKGCKQVSPRK